MFCRERGILERDRQDNRDKIETLKCKMKQMKQRESDLFDEKCKSRKSSIDRTAELELRIAKLRSDLEASQEELDGCRMLLANKPDIDKLKYNEQIQQFKLKISDLESKELYLNAELSRLEKRKTEADQAITELETVKNQLQMEKLRGDKLSAELEANNDAVIQRSVMKEKLAKFDDLDKENYRLKSTNKLLTETAENAALLKEKVKQLESDRKRMETKCQLMNEVRFISIFDRVRSIHHELIHIKIMLIKFNTLLAIIKSNILIIK